MKERDKGSKGTFDLVGKELCPPITVLRFGNRAFMIFDIGGKRRVSFVVRVALVDPFKRGASFVVPSLLYEPARAFGNAASDSWAMSVSAK